MEIKSVRCSYNHEAAIWTRVSIIIKHKPKNVDAFQNKGLRKTFGINHVHFSRIRDQQVIATANQEAKPKTHTK